ncbi:MAG: nickel pincer cofactor biosynthesis protein LarB [Bacillota bacterium]|nr:nickel pincer cofactor biosynthesis protein LarB [Bacillota bacterium]
MNPDALRRLLEAVRQGQQSVDEAIESLRNLPFEDLGYARVDHHRALRRGLPEVIYCPGKTPAQVAGIASRLRSVNPVVLATRATADVYDEVVKLCPDASYDPTGRLIVIGKPEAVPGMGRPLVVAAGTSDLPVAEEAAGTLIAYGHEVARLYDVGVAGLHRLLGSLDRLQQADVLIVVAGMDGALPSVIGGLCGQPVIAVPTSVGYGSSFGGLAALLAMLNSCASGVAVVNIDNGFGAALMADAILRTAKKAFSASSGGAPTALEGD